MTLAEVVRAFNGRGRGNKYRARCPCHKGKSDSLAIYQDEDRIRIHCHAGCKNDDVLAAVGLDWKALTPHRERLNPKEYREWKRKQHEEEVLEYRGRIRNWMVLFANVPYTVRQYHADCDVAVAMAMNLAGGNDKPHVHHLLRNAMERITAAHILKSRKP